MVGISGRGSREGGEGFGYGGEDAGAGLVERVGQGGAGGETMAAAAELLGDLGHVGAARPEADLHVAARLLHEQQADLAAGAAADVVDPAFAGLPHAPTPSPSSPPT